MKRFDKWMLFLVTIALFLSACMAQMQSPNVAQTNTEKPDAPEITQIEIWAVRDPQEGAQIALAEALGYYKDEGLDVTIKWVASGGELFNALTSGQIQIFGESVFYSVLSPDFGFTYRFVMPLADISGTQSFVLGPNTTLNTPKDLEGKKVGMAAGAGVVSAIKSMAARYEVDFSKIEFVNLQPADQTPALVKGDIDAMAVWQPWALSATKVGGKLYFTGNRSYIEGKEEAVNWMYLDAGLNVQGDFLKQNPNTVRALMRALMRATDYINQHPLEEPAKLLSPILNVPSEELQAIMALNIYTNEVQPYMLEGMDVELQRLFEAKLAQKLHNANEGYELGLLREIAPEKVKVDGL